MILVPKKGGIKKRWERWLEKQDKITRGEILFRDSWLKKPCVFLYRRGITANHITAFRSFILLPIWILWYEIFKFDSLGLHIFFASAIGFLDALDGPMARNNDDVTPQGTLGDYFGDLADLIYMGRIGLEYGLPPYLFLSILGVEVLALY